MTKVVSCKPRKMQQPRIHFTHNIKYSNLKIATYKKKLLSIQLWPKVI